MVALALTPCWAFACSVGFELQGSIVDATICANVGAVNLDDFASKRRDDEIDEVTALGQSVRIARPKDACTARLVVGSAHFKSTPTNGNLIGHATTDFL